MRFMNRLKILAVLLVGLAAAAGAARAQLQSEAGFIRLEENVSYLHVGSYFNRIVLRTSPARIWYAFQPADEEPAAKPLFVFFNGGPGGATSCGLFSASTARFAVLRDEGTGEAAVVANPASWTALGNVLYIDSRTAGFSYSLMDDPGDSIRRTREFDAQNYNPFVDGADFVRALIKFLAAHPAIRPNRVVLVPESYGGIRTTVMLNFLLYPERYVDGSSVYQDPGLVEAIRGHYEAVFPEYAGGPVPPGIVAGQFGHQILIQTALTFSYQRSVAVRMLESPGSPIDLVAAETGVPYIPYAESPGAVPNPSSSQVMNHIYTYLEAAGRDPYIVIKPSGFFDGHRAASEAFLTRVDTLNLMTGVDVTGILDMYATSRTEAYKMKTALGGSASGSAFQALRDAARPTSGRRTPGKLAGHPPAARRPQGMFLNRRPTAAIDLFALVGPPPGPESLATWFAPPGENDMTAIFGSLQPWDRFFIDLNYDVANAFAYNKATLQEYRIQYNNSELFGRLFLENAAWAETFATDAAWDVVVYSPSIPEALGMHSDILSSSRYEADSPPGAARPGEIQLVYRTSSVPGASVTTRTIRFPNYPLSGHAVTMTEPSAILDDVREWLAATGIPTPGR